MGYFCIESKKVEFIHRTNWIVIPEEIAVVKFWNFTFEVKGVRKISSVKLHFIVSWFDSSEVIPTCALGIDRSVSLMRRTLDCNGKLSWTRDREVLAPELNQDSASDTHTGASDTNTAGEERSRAIGPYSPVLNHRKGKTNQPSLRVSK